MKKAFLVEYEHITRALSETSIIALISLLPMVVIVLIKCWGTSKMSLHEGFSFSISQGELFLYAVSFIAGAYSTALADDYPFIKKKFLGRKTVITFSTVLIGIAMAFIVLQRISFDSAGNDLNWSQIIPASCFVFLLSLIMYGFSVSVRNYQHLSNETSAKLDRAKQDDFSSTYRQHRGEK